MRRGWFMPFSKKSDLKAIAFEYLGYGRFSLGVNLSYEKFTDGDWESYLIFHLGTYQLSIGKMYK